jgi:hypothetical protein
MGVEQIVTIGVSLTVWIDEELRLIRGLADRYLPALLV